MSKTLPLVQSYSATVTNSITSANWIPRAIWAFIDMALLLAVECPLGAFAQGTSSADDA
jgi:hypothetical protein